MAEDGPREPRFFAMAMLYGGLSALYFTSFADRVDLGAPLTVTVLGIAAAVGAAAGLVLPARAWQGRSAEGPLRLSFGFVAVTAGLGMCGMWLARVDAAVLAMGCFLVGFVFLSLVCGARSLVSRRA